MKTIVLCREHCFLLLIVSPKCCFILLSIITHNRYLRRNVMVRPSAWNLAHLQMNLLILQLGDGGYVQVNSQTPKLNLNTAGNHNAFKFRRSNSNFTEFKTTNCLGSAYTHLKFCPIVTTAFHTLNLYFCYS